VVPVEVIPFAITPVMKRITGMGAYPLIREGNAKDGPVITDNGNYILDCSFSGIVNPGELEDTITAIPGVVECGLFCNYTGKTTVIIGGEKGCRVVDGRKNQEI
jgi:ribose 5-phosphate isomerase A